MPSSPLPIFDSFMVSAAHQGLCQALEMQVIKVVTVTYSEMLWNKQWVEEEDNHISYC